LEFSQAFPIAIIDEDYEGKSAAGRGMRQLAAAIEKEGYRVVAGVSYADARRLVNVFNSESCWLISIDGTEATPAQWLSVTNPSQHSRYSPRLDSDASSPMSRLDIRMNVAFVVRTLAKRQRFRHGSKTQARISQIGRRSRLRACGRDNRLLRRSLYRRASSG
jgi:Orn/Lys/Arg decarboxylase, N-terminal domain